MQGFSFHRLNEWLSCRSLQENLPAQVFLHQSCPGSGGIDDDGKIYATFVFANVEIGSSA